MGYSMYDTKTSNLLQGKPVIVLELELFIAKVQEFLEAQQLEENHWLHSLSPCIALDLLRVTTLRVAGEMISMGSKKCFS